MPKLNDINGNTYGKWTVIELASRNPVFWKCKCECGTIKNVLSINLTSGKTKSCGCTKSVKDISNKRFGNLVAVRYIKNGKWECRCDCGKTKKIQRYLLEKDIQLNCSCKRGLHVGQSLRRLSDKQKTINTLFQKYKENAHTRNIEFNLTKDDIANYIFNDCEYCGSEPSNSTTYKHRRRKVIPSNYNGIDRIDSSKGYIVGNLRTCCKDCNYMKRHHSSDYFIAHIKKIASYVLEKQSCDITTEGNK